MIVASENQVWQQPGGWRRVSETHTDQDGKKYTRQWTAAANMDLDAALAAHAEELSAALAESEAAQILG